MIFKEIQELKSVQLLLNKKCNVYVVGGWVRDQILNIPSNDVDLVVEKASPQLMLDLGFKSVGNDFPVFLDDMGNELALTRMERKKEKTSKNDYTNFEFKTNNVSIEEDLLRRDLVINSMAINLKTGVIIDPFNGKGDLEQKVLRITSEAFKEDPLRILRYARFLSKLPNFTIDKKSEKMIIEMIKEGKLNNLTKERIFKEIEKVLLSKKPSRFFNFLIKVEGIKKLFPFENENDLNNFKEKLKKINSLSNKLTNRKIIKKEKINFLFTYLIIDFNYEQLKQINDFYGLSKDINYNIKQFKEHNLRNNINELKKDLINKKFNKIISFFDSFYLINKMTNSNTKNKQLINERNFKNIYNILKKNISLDKFFSRYEKKNNKKPTVKEIKEQISKMKIINLTLFSYEENISFCKNILKI